MKIPNDSLREASAALGRAQRPLLLVGPEARPVASALRRIADRLGAAMLNTPDGLSLVEGARSSGTFSFGAGAQAKAVAEHTDLVLAVSGLGEFTNLAGRAFQQAKVIHVSEDVTDIGRNMTPEFALVGDPRVTVSELERLITATVTQVRERWADSLAPVVAEPSWPTRAGVIHPAAAIEALQSALPAAARVCVDVTSAGLYLGMGFKPKPTQRVFSSIEQSACMGEALMASLGVRLASGLPTVALTGDWCYAMSPSELHFAVEQKLDAYVVLVWANAGGGLVSTGVAQQGIAVPERAHRWHAPPHFARLARALNATAIRVSTAKALARALRSGFRSKRPLLIEAQIDAAVPVPAGDRFLVLSAERGLES